MAEVELPLPAYALDKIPGRFVDDIAEIFAPAFGNEEGLLTPAAGANPGRRIVGDLI